MNIKDSYIHNGTAVVKDIKVENSVLKKILAGKDANDEYLDWETVCNLTGIKPTAAEVADSVKVLGYSINNDAPDAIQYLLFVDSNNTDEAARENLYSSWGLRYYPRLGSLLEGGASAASGKYAHAEGNNTYAWSDWSHAEGNYSRINGSSGGHAEGYYSFINQSSYAHVEGYQCQANYAWYSHAEGYYTTTTTAAEHAEGQFNYSRGNTLHSVGIGDSTTNRVNAFEIQYNGNAYMFGVGGNDGQNTLGNTLQAHLNTSLISEFKWAYILGETTDAPETVNTIYLDDVSDTECNRLGMTEEEFLEACANDELPGYSLYYNSTRMVKTNETLEYEDVEYVVFKEANGLDSDDIGCQGQHAFRVLIDPEVDTPERLNAASIYGGGNGSYGYISFNPCDSNSIYESGDGERTTHHYLLKVE